jgi:hypothetical protein
MKKFDLDAFNALCDDARAALADLEEAGEEFQARCAAQHGLEPQQVQVLISGDMTRVVAITPPLDRHK